MVYIIRKNLEQNLARLTLVFFISMGVKSCIYSPIRRYEGITKSMNEVAAFQSGGIADINNDGTLSEEEKRVRENFYEECKNNFCALGSKFNSSKAFFAGIQIAASARPSKQTFFLKRKKPYLQRSFHFHKN